MAHLPLTWFFQKRSEFIYTLNDLCICWQYEIWFREQQTSIKYFESFIAAYK